MATVFPDVVILPSEPAVKKFLVAAAKMTQCEYDLNEVVEEVLVAVGLPSRHERAEVLLATVDDNHLSVRDADILTRAKLELAKELGDQCTQLGLYDEQGVLGYRPTGWLLDADIVLTRGDLHEGEVGNAGGDHR